MRCHVRRTGHDAFTLGWKWRAQKKPGFHIKTHYDGHALSKSFGIPPFRGSTTPTLEDRCSVFDFQLCLLILDKSVGSFSKLFDAQRGACGSLQLRSGFSFLHHLRMGDYMVGMSLHEEGQYACYADGIRKCSCPFRLAQLAESATAREVMGTGEIDNDNTHKSDHNSRTCL